MRNVQKIGVKPRNGHIDIPADAHTVFYRMHEQSGAAFADMLGNGGDLTLAASGTGTPLANAGYVTPDGTNHYLQRDADAYLNALLRLDQEYGQILTAFDFYWDGAATGTECFFFAGVSNPACGGWGLALNSAGQVVWVSRGIGASNHATNPFTGYALTSLSSQRISVLVETIYKTASTVDANLYVNGTARVALTGINLLHNNGTAPYGSLQIIPTDVQAYSIGCRPTALATRDWLLNSAASNGRIGRFLADRRARDATLAQKVATELYLYQGEVPRVLVGA